MTRDQGIPDPQRPGQPLGSGEEVRLPNLSASRRIPPPPPPSIPLTQAPRLPKQEAAPPPPPPNIPLTQAPRLPKQEAVPVSTGAQKVKTASPRRTRAKANSPRSTQPPAVSPISDPTDPAFNARRRWLNWLINWKIWVIIMALICGGSAALSLALLLHLPSLPNCPAIFWPLASASLRFECARLAAGKQTTKDLLEAIALVDSLPADHPLRAQADELVETWSQEVLNLAEEQFHAGKLAEAIAAARKISPKVSAYRLVEERIERWQSIWSKAENTYKQAEAALRKLDWRQAFTLAVRLLDIENTYWQTTKYRDLSNRISIAREDGSKLGRAQRLADEGGLKSLLEAIKLVESIDEKSYVYQAARKLVKQFGRKMLDLAQDALDRRDLAGALSIVSQIPDSAKLDEEAKDLTVLANAQSQAWGNTVSGLEEAITQAQRIGSNRPLYNKAQRFIERWQLEIVAIAQLEKARVLAQPGTIEDLKLAIEEASTIARSNPRWDEVQRQISSWTAQIQTAEDRPILDQAEQVAIQGDVASLQAAVAQAGQVGQGRALSKEAQTKIRDWTAEIQRIQDQPYLDRAREIASSGDLTSAIAAAEQVKPGRSLYNEAQKDIQRWRSQIRAEEAEAEALRNLQEARRLANLGSADSLVRAINLADQVSGSLKTEATDAINEWSWQLLQVADSQALYDLPGAIAVAQKIPAQAASYSTAQQNIQAWKKQLGQ